MYLKTVSGKEFLVAWAGVASIDAALRFTLLEVSASTAFSVFTNPSECKVLVFNNDGTMQLYENYTVFKSIDINADGSVMIALGKE